LADILDDGRNNKIDANGAFDITRQIGQALDYAHRCGVVHADIKPGNIIITPEGQAKQAKGREKVERVTLVRGAKRWELECAYLACGFHLAPNTELAELAGCVVENGSVRVDEFQQTSVPDVYSAGESTGIGGLELSIVEGEIAGLAAAAKHETARELFTFRKQQQRFARLLNSTFALREELRSLVEPETIVCRCEDVTFERLRSQSSWRAAKLQTRCGMGPCQGRVCGGAVEFLFGWRAESVRPPAFPVRVENLTTD
jgi:serine/threonine protein kinase